MNFIHLKSAHASCDSYEPGVLTAHYFVILPPRLQSAPTSSCNFTLSYY